MHLHLCMNETTNTKRQDGQWPEARLERTIRLRLVPQSVPSLLLSHTDVTSFLGSFTIRTTVWIAPSLLMPLLLVHHFVILGNKVWNKESVLISGCWLTLVLSVWLEWAVSTTLVNYSFSVGWWFFFSPSLYTGNIQPSLSGMYLGRKKLANFMSQFMIEFNMRWKAACSM